MRKIVIAQGAAIILLLVVLIAVLLARGNAAPGITRNPTATAIPTPSATPTLVPTATDTPAPTATSTPLPKAGDVLCNVDVGTWTGGSSDWRNSNGLLINDGTTHPSGGSPTIVAPCRLDGIDNYAVETKIQVARINGNGSPALGVSVRGSTTSDGWKGYTACVSPSIYCGGLYAYAAIFGVGASFPIRAETLFTLGTRMYTFRVEVNGSVIKFFIDGASVVTLTDFTFPSGSQVGLWSGDMQIEVFSFQVTLL